MASSRKVDVSVIIPSYNDGEGVLRLIEQLSEKAPKQKQIVVVESGKSDYFSVLRKRRNIVLVKSSKNRRGRAKQQNDGARKATGRVLLFLHADSNIARVSLMTLTRIKRDVWGSFLIRFDSQHPYMRFVEWMSNIRAAYLSIAFGDQGLFVSKGLFERVGGFSEHDAFEDLHLSYTLRTLKRKITLRSRIVSSARRFEKYGYIKTHVIMGLIVFTYLLGLKNVSKKLYGFIR